MVQEDINTAANLALGLDKVLAFARGRESREDRSLGMSEAREGGRRDWGGFPGRGRQSFRHTLGTEAAGRSRGQCARVCAHLRVFSVFLQCSAELGADVCVH